MNADQQMDERTPAGALHKPGWRLTFHDEYDGATLNDMHLCRIDSVRVYARG